MLSRRLAQLVEANNQRSPPPTSVPRRASASEVASTPAPASNVTGVPDVNALVAALHQHQNQLDQSQRQRLSLLNSLGSTSSVALDRDANTQAQAILKHHEDQLRTARLFLERQQQQGNAGEQSQQQEQSPQNPFLMASNALASAKAAQASILNGMSSSNLLLPAGLASGTSTGVAAASGGTDMGADERLARLLTEQQLLQGENYIHALLAANAGRGNLAVGPATAAAAAAAQQNNNAPHSAEAADHKTETDRRQNGDARALGSRSGNATIAAGESNQRNGNMVGELMEDDHTDREGDDEEEGYDDNLSDEVYFKDFAANDDNRVIQETFPLKLYRMLFEVEQEGHENIVSFLPHGRSFVVHKPKAFVEVCKSRLDEPLYPQVTFSRCLLQTYNVAATHQ